MAYRVDFLANHSIGKVKLIAKLKVLGLTPERASGTFVLNSRGNVPAILPKFVLAPIAGRLMTKLDYAKAIALLSADGGLAQSEVARLLNRQERWVSFINKLNLMPQSLLKYLPATVKATTLIKGVDTFGAHRVEVAIRVFAARHPGKKLTERALREQVAAIYVCLAIVEKLATTRQELA